MADVARAEQAVVRLSKHGKLNARPAIAVIANAEERARRALFFLDLCLLCSVLLGSTWERSSEFQENEQAWRGRVI